MNQSELVTPASMSAQVCDLGVLAIFKNETLNLRVWLEHYLWQGVEHFFLIDNGSTDDPVGRVLRPYLDRGQVTYEYRPEPHAQPQHYAHMFRAHVCGGRCRWLLVCDLDEFVFAAPGHAPSLAARVRQLDPHLDAVYVHWRMFASAEFNNHHPTSPETLLDPRTGHPLDLRVALTRCRPGLHADHKYLFRTSIVRDPAQVWIHRLLDHAPADRVAFDDEGLRLHHYQTQSRFYFDTVKRVRGDADGFLPDTARDWAYYAAANEGMVEEDAMLAQLVGGQLRSPPSY
jgi:hypothetical protein